MYKKQSFETNVLNTITREAPNYYNYLVKKHYLLYSPSFKNKNIYEVEAKTFNYKHLTGVTSELNGRDFFIKAINGTLNTADFHITREGYTYRQSKDVIKDKMKALCSMDSIFSQQSQAVESFERPSFHCSVAVSSGDTLLGYTISKPHLPMSLLHVDLSKKYTTNEPLLILSGPSSSKKYDKLVKGNYLDIVTAYPALRNYLSDELIDETSKIMPSILIFKELYNLFDTYPDYIEL